MIEIDLEEDGLVRLEQTAESAPNSQQFCFVCKGDGNLCRCQNCPKAYHYQGRCCQNNPQFFEMTENGQWHCPCCRLRNVCTQCNRVVTEQGMVCGICSRQIHQECLKISMQLPIEKRKVGGVAQFIVNCRSCLEQSTIKDWLQQKSLAGQSYSLVIPLYSSSIHKCWLPTDMARAILSKQKYMLKKTTTYTIALQSRPAEILNVKASSKYCQVNQGQWQRIIKHQRQYNDFGELDNFRVHIRWIGTSYSQATWQDVTFPSQLPIQRYFSKKPNRPPLPSINIIQSTSRNQEYNRQRRQLIPLVASYSLLIITEQSNFFGWQALLINHHPEKYIATLNNDEEDREYVMNYRVVGKWRKFDILLVTPQSFRIFKQDLKIRDFVLIWDVGSPNSLEELIGGIWLFKYPNINNEHLMVLLGTRYKELELIRSYKSQQKKMTQTVVPTVKVSQPINQPPKETAPQAQPQKPKSRMQIYTQKTIQKNLRIAVQPPQQVSKSLINIMPKVVSQSEERKSKSVLHIEQTNQLYQRYFRERTEVLKQLQMNQAKRLVILHFIVSFGISFDNFNKFYQRLTKSCPQLFLPDSHQQMQSVRKYLQLLLAIVFREKWISSDSIEISTLFFNYNHRSLMKHFLELENLKRLYEANGGDPAKWPYNRLFLLGIKDGKHVDAQCWTSQDDLELVRLTLHYGFGNWENIVRNFMKHRKDFQGQEYVLRRLRPSYKPKHNQTILGWCSVMLNSRMSSMLSDLWKTQKMQN